MALAPLRRLPSQVFREHAQLTPDASQSAALAVLDGTAREIARYVTTRRQYAVARARVDRLVASEAARMLDADAATWYPRRLLRAAMGRTTDVRVRELEAAVAARERCPPRPAPPRGVYLVGDVGVGKTTLMRALQASAAQACPVDSVVSVHYSAMVQWMHARLHEYDCEPPAERRRRGWEHPLDAVLPAAERAAGAPPFEHNARGLFGAAISRGTGGLLCLDEFQLADVADARLLQGCLTRVMEHGFVIAMTSNRVAAEHNPQFLHHAGYRGFLDFLDERCAVQQVGCGPGGELTPPSSSASPSDVDVHVDYRERLYRSRDAASTVIFSASDPVSERKLRECWRQEARCEWDEVLQATVRVGMGRKFTARRAAPGSFAAQFTLDELVHSAVGPADFAALARRFHVLFVTDVVPPVGATSRDVAQRWIWLIDAAYAHGCKIAMRVDADSIGAAFSADALAGRDQAAVAEAGEFESERARVRGPAGEADAPRAAAAAATALYTDAGELFALRRAASRLLEMQTPEYGKGRRDGGEGGLEGAWG